MLTVDQQHRVDVTMQVGNLQQQVEVSAAAVQVETTSTQLGTVIEEKNIVESAAERPQLHRPALDPGRRGARRRRPPGLISVNGQREASNAFLVNGGDVSEGRTMGAGVIPNLDSVAEFRLITNSFDAEYGRFSGAVMNAITKSGTNGFHGTAFEFLRNSDMDARAFFDPAVTRAEAQSVRLRGRRAGDQEQGFLVHRLSGHAAAPGLVRQPDAVAQRGAAQRQFQPERSERRGQRPVLGAGAVAAAGLRGHRERAVQHARCATHGALRLSRRRDSGQRAFRRSRPTC